MKEKEDDSLYARWLSGELSEEEKQKLESSGDAALLRSIIASVDAFEIPDLKDNSYAEIQAKIQKRKAKIIPMYRRPAFIAAAALILALAGIFLFWQPEKNELLPSAPVALVSSVGQVKSIDLPDHTGIKLYGKSKLTYDKNSYGKNRVLNLEGEAYFDVRKKGHFEVRFEQGTVLVKGTKFNVLSDKKETSVRCYEGKVEVLLGENKVVLTKGQGVRLGAGQKLETYSFDQDKMHLDESKFVENVSLNEVCTSLSVYYGVQFETGNVDMNRTFTGSIYLGDLNTALGIIFTPMSIAHEANGTQVVLSNK